MLIRCFDCNRDPAGRWVQPPALIFIDEPPRCIARDPSHYRCRTHLSAKREEEIQTRERALGFQIN
jgi:hypothetical protein